MKNNIKLYGNKYLNEPTEPVLEFDSTLVRVAQNMMSACSTHGGYALAANQIGKKISMFVFRYNDTYRVAVNPTLELLPKRTATYSEGCLSIPGLRFEIQRPHSVVLHGHDLHGSYYEMKAQGLTARAIQHEHDHLMGITMYDHLNEDQRKVFDELWPRAKKLYLTHSYKDFLYKWHAFENSYH